MRALTGETTLAAMLVDRVATDSASKEATTLMPPPRLPISPKSSVGSQMVRPKMSGVALVTATPMKANSVMVAGRPMACPRIWSFWLLA